MLPSSNQGSLNLSIYGGSRVCEPFLFRFDKFRNTTLKHRLVALAVGNYAVGLRARFALSCEISLCET